jgi:hypothetical protein
VDADEIPELLKGFDALLAVQSNPTPFDNFEVRYTTRGELEVAAYSSERGDVRFAVQAGRRPLTARRLGIDATELLRLRSSFQAASLKLQAAASGTATRNVNANERSRAELFGKFTLGDAANVRAMAIPTPAGSKADVKSGPPDNIEVHLNASAEEFRAFYTAALPKYNWTADSNDCWKRRHPISAKNQTLCLDLQLEGLARIRISDQ